MTTSFPDRLPKWCGLTTGALVTAYIFTQTLAETLWGRPSSTAALGFMVAPIAGVIAGVVAFLVGLALRAALRSSSAASRPAPSWVPKALWLTVLVGAVAFLLMGRSSVMTLEAARMPRVILDAGRITAVTPPTMQLQERVAAPELQSGITNTHDAHPIDWNGVAIRVENKDEQVVVNNTNGMRLASADLHAFDYINGIHATSVCTQPDGRRLLAVLVSLRATSRRTMFLVFGADGSLVFQQHLERSQGVKDTFYTGQLNGAEAMTVDLGTLSTWTCAR